MYLEKINRRWSASMGAAGFTEKLTITNTTKLNVSERLYMLEFAYNEKRYHMYHALGETAYELRILDEAYTPTSLEAVFRMDDQSSKEWIELVNGFMLQNYEGIQTSVDVSEGLAEAKSSIHRARFMVGR